MKNFSKKTLKALTAQGISVLGLGYAPSEDRGFSDPILIVNLDDNGCHRVRTYLEVLEMAR